jgi:hypothetical protein
MYFRCLVINQQANAAHHQKCDHFRVPYSDLRIESAIGHLDSVSGRLRPGQASNLLLLRADRQSASRTLSGAHPEFAC